MSQATNLTCDQLHQKAMDFANNGLMAEKQGNKAQALKQYMDAFQYEKQAAMTLAYDFSIEPSRSVLFRSAAYLAIKAKKYSEAERMAAFGLIGNPPSEIAQELREALKETFKHLKIAA